MLINNVIYGGGVVNVLVSREMALHLPHKVPIKKRKPKGLKVNA